MVIGNVKDVSQGRKQQHVHVVIQVNLPMVVLHWKNAVLGNAHIIAAMLKLDTQIDK